MPKLHSHTSVTPVSLHCQKHYRENNPLQYRQDVKMTDSIDTHSLGRKQLLRHMTRD